MPLSQNLKTSTLILLLSFISTTPLYAQIYKFTDADGNVTYSDKARPRASVITLTAPQTYTPNTRPQSTTAPIKHRPKPTTSTRHYQSIQIRQPENEMSYHKNSGQLDISLLIEPPLQTTSGHKIALTLDGKTRSQHYTQSTMTLDELYRGKHTLKASILDRKNKPLIHSNTSIFYIHKVSIRR